MRGAAASSWMQQLPHRLRQKSVRIQVVFFDIQRPILPLEIACSISADAMPEDEILRARRRSDGIGLHEPEPLDGVRQCRGREKEIVKSRKSATSARSRYPVCRAATDIHVSTFSPAMYSHAVLRIENADDAIDLVLRRPVELADIAVIPEPAPECGLFP